MKNKKLTEVKMLESKHQAAFFEWLEHRHPKLRRLCFAVPNGGARNIKEAVNLKRQGVTAGVCDIVCLIPNKQKHGLLIEMKVGNNKPSQAQEDFMNCVIANNYEAIVCYSVDEAVSNFMNYIQF